MAESENTTKQSNGVVLTVASGEEGVKQEVNLCVVLNRLISAIFFPDHSSFTPPLLHRIKSSLAQNSTLLPEASRNTGRDVLLWTRQGSSFRALFVLSVGTISLLTLTGFLVFMLFFVAATVNAVVISLLMSVAAAGGFLALFFACVAAIYIGALSVAVFVISTATISAVIAVLITTGNIIVGPQGNPLCNAPVPDSWPDLGGYTDKRAPETINQERHRKTRTKGKYQSKNNNQKDCFIIVLALSTPPIHTYQQNETPKGCDDYTAIHP